MAPIFKPQSQPAPLLVITRIQVLLFFFCGQNINLLPFHNQNAFNRTSLAPDTYLIDGVGGGPCLLVLPRISLKGHKGKLHLLRRLVSHNSMGAEWLFLFFLLLTVSRSYRNVAVLPPPLLLVQFCSEKCSVNITEETL